MSVRLCVGDCPARIVRVCSAHKGFAWLEVSTEGIAAHGSRPQEGVDAIRAMGKALQELELLVFQLYWNGVWRMPCWHGFAACVAD